MTAVCSCKGFKVSDNIVEWVPAEGFVCVRNVFNVSRHTGQREISLCNIAGDKKLHFLLWNKFRDL